MKQYRRQKLKSGACFILDVALVVMCVYAMIAEYAEWKARCVKHFAAWILTLTILSILSLLDNILNFVLVWKMENKFLDEKHNASQTYQ